MFRSRNYFIVLSVAALSTCLMPVFVWATDFLRFTGVLLWLLSCAIVIVMTVKMILGEEERKASITPIRPRSKPVTLKKAG